MEQQVKELGDFDVVTVTSGSSVGVMTKFCCFVPSLSFSSHADMP